MEFYSVFKYLVFDYKFEIQKRTLSSNVIATNRPDINKIRKAFWSRRNRSFAFSKTFSKITNRRKAQHKKSPKAGAVVSLAAMVAGMSSMPIVQADQQPSDSLMQEKSKLSKSDSLSMDQGYHKLLGLCS